MSTVWYSDGPGSPIISPVEAARLAGIDETSLDVTLGWTVERSSWLDDPSYHIRTVLSGYALTRAVNEGRIVGLPVRLSVVPALIESAPPDLAVVGGVARGSTFAFACGVGWGDVLARVAKRVVVEIDEHGPDLGAPEIVGNVVATVPRPPTPPEPPASPRPADDVDLRIGALVAGLLPDDPTLQFGPGGIGAGIARSLDRPVRIWSGLITDQMAELHERGLLVGPAVGAYAWGGDPVRALAAAGQLELCSSTITHDLGRLATTPRFVGCNTALQVGLDGAVNVERVGSRVIAAVGGHADFCLAASRSVGGISIIAVRSTTAKGASTIVPAVDAVSTSRTDIDVVVTEHGVADLRGVGDDERRRRLVAIAAPGHRQSLLAVD